METTTYTREEYAQSSIVNASKFVTDDSTWRGFGFAKRPRRGMIFNKFVDKELIIWERFILRESFIYFLMAHFRFMCDSISHETKIHCIKIAYQFLQQQAQDWPEMYNLNWAQYTDIFNQRIVAYMNVESAEEFRMVFMDLGLSEVHLKYHANLFVGAINMMDMGVMMTMTDSVRIIE